MNKLFIVFLAICLVSVHAFVKRDAPAAQPNALDDIVKQLNAFKDDIAKKVDESMNPDQIKKAFGTFVDNINTAIHSLQPSTEAPK